MFIKTKTMANEIREVLEEKGLKVGVGWSEDNIFIEVYEDDYDYSELILKYLEGEKVEEYVATILSILNDKANRSKYVKVHKASPVKRFLIDLIKHYKCDDFLYIHRNDLHGEFENNYIPIDDIVDFNYSPFGDVLRLQEDQGGDEYFYTIDFEHKTIETRVELLEDMDFSEAN